MREIHSTAFALFCVISVSGCDCGQGVLTGNTDSALDGDEELFTDAQDHAEALDDVLSESENPCWDSDGDGHDDMRCGGDDCDDSDPETYPGGPVDCPTWEDPDCREPEGGPIMHDAQLLVKLVHTGPALYYQLLWKSTEYALFFSRNNVGDIAFLRFNPREGFVSDAARIRPYVEHYKAAWTGSRFGTVWADEEEEIFGIFFQNLSPTGEPQGEITRISEPDPGLRPWNQTILWDGTGFRVLWFEVFGSSFGLNLAALDEDGTMLSDIVQVTSHPTPFTGGMTAAWTGSGLGIAWCSQTYYFPHHDDIFFTRVSGDGSEVGENIRVDNRAYCNPYPKASWTGSEFGIFWQSDAIEGELPASCLEGCDVTLSRRNADGESLGDDVIVAATDFFAAEPRIVWAEGGYGLIWIERGEESDRLFFQRLHRTGLPIELPFEIPTELHVNPADMVWTGTAFGILWIEHHDFTVSTDLFVRFMEIQICE